MSAQADALMAIFGHKRVGNDDSQGSAEGATSGIRESDATGEAGEVDADLRRQPGRNNRAKSNAGSRSVSIKPARLKKCAQCRCEFQPQRMGQKACSPSCAAEIAKKKREKVEKANDRQKRDSLKTKAQWAKDAQAAVNAYVRVRDAGKPCISCGRMHEGQWHAGHYLSRGAHPELALEPLNIWRQCAPCNTYLSGNQIEFRKGLIARYGTELVEWLEGPHAPKHHSIDDLKDIAAKFRKMTKEIINGWG